MVEMQIWGWSPRRPRTSAIHRQTRWGKFSCDCAMGWRGFWRFLGQSSSCRMCRSCLHGEGVAAPSYGCACADVCAFLRCPGWTQMSKMRVVSAQPKVGKRDFGTFLARLKIGLNRLNCIFQKKRVEPVQPDFLKKNRVDPAQLGFRKKSVSNKLNPKKLGKIGLSRLNSRFSKKLSLLHLTRIKRCERKTENSNRNRILAA